jgi:hypothetical protein
LPRLDSNHDPQISASQVARVTGVSHHCLVNIYFSKETVRKISRQVTNWEKIFLNLTSSKGFYPE